MSLKLITAPAAEPILLATAKAHLRVDHSSDDALITSLITAARLAAEDRLGRRLINQTWELVIDAFPSAEIKVGVLPVVSITSVKYIDAAGAEITLASDQYTLDADTLPGWLLPAYGVDWPATRDVANAVRVRFVCGYGADGTAVPQPIIQWMLLTIGTLYAHREAVVAGQMAEVPRTFVDGLLDPYRLMEIG